MEYAKTLLISVVVSAIVAAINDVIAPIIETSVIISDCWNKGNSLDIRKTPAVTIVAEWIRAETEVGPSIASGNQLCKGNWADLPIAPIKKPKDIIVAEFVEIWSETIAIYKFGISNRSGFILYGGNV